VRIIIEDLKIVPDSASPLFSPLAAPATHPVIWEEDERMVSRIPETERRMRERREKRREREGSAGAPTAERNNCSGRSLRSAIISQPL
jgi:hypothetical protein